MSSGLLPADLARRVLFWVTCGGDYGAGHWARSQALITKLPDSWECAVASTGPTVAKPGARVRQVLIDDVPWDAAALAAAMDQLGWDSGPDLLVLDGRWPLRRKQVAQLRGRWPDAYLVAVDQEHAGPHAVDLHVVPDPGCQSLQASVLAGGPYTIVGRAMAPREWHYPKQPARILVTAGQRDPHGISRLFVEALSLCRQHVVVDVVIGAGFDPWPVTATPELDIQFHEGLDDLRPLMRQADLALSAYGVTCFELANAGIPTLSLCHTEEDVPFLERVEGLGFLVSAGWVAEVQAGQVAHQIDELLEDPLLLRSMAEIGPHVIDGRAAERVATALVEALEPQRHELGTYS